MEAVIERLTDLEAIFGSFVAHTDRAIRNMSNEVAQLSREMKEFKDEMKEFKDEMKEFKDEMKEFKDEMEVHIVKQDEWRIEVDRDRKIINNEWKKQVDKERRKMNKQWGNLANKMGTIVEDIISPAVRPLIKRYFKKTISDFSINRKRFAGNLQGEYDVVAVCEDCVFIVEAKTSPKEAYLYKFLENIEKFKILFPEYNDKQIIPIYAGLRMEQDLINLATTNKIYAMAYREWDYMDLLNFPL